MTVEESETEELRSFRETWKREVRERQWPEHPITPSVQAPASEAGVHHAPRDDALEVYNQAIRHEQAGELDEALRLYRQAFRMNPNVDKVYHLREKAARALEASALIPTPVDRGTETKAVDTFGLGSVVRGVAPTSTKLVSSSVHHPDRYVSGVLVRIVAGFPEILSFEPEDEKDPPFLQRLPDELLVYILRHLGTMAIERFARVCRKARVITLDTAIWRLGFLLAFIIRLYLPSSVPLNQHLANWLYAHVNVVLL